PPAVTLGGGSVVTTNWLAAAASTVNTFVVAAVRPGVVACNARPVATEFRIKFEKNATPAVATMLTTPAGPPPPESMSATVTVPANVGSIFPNSSTADTPTPYPTPAMTVGGG